MSRCSLQRDTGDGRLRRGQKSPLVFTDGTAQLTPELWDPATEQFTKLAPGTVPRTYHRCTIVPTTPLTGA